LMPNESFHDQTKIFTYQGCQDYENSKKRLSIYFYRAAVFFSKSIYFCTAIASAKDNTCTSQALPEATGTHKRAAPWVFSRYELSLWQDGDRVL